MTPLSPAEREHLPTTLPGWHLADGRDAITRTIRFPDFAAAWSFMTEVAALAEQQDHHPEWSNTYNLVTITLTTHATQTLTTRDLTLAQSINQTLTHPQKTAPAKAPR